MVKNLPANPGNIRDTGLIPGSGRSLEKEMATSTVFLAGESHGHKSLAGYRPWGHKESDMTEEVGTHIYKTRTVSKPLRACLAGIGIQYFEGSGDLSLGTL